LGRGINELGRDDGDTVKTLADLAREPREIIDDSVMIRFRSRGTRVPNGAGI
jgi:hypothetical protein